MFRKFLLDLLDFLYQASDLFSFFLLFFKDRVNWSRSSPLRLSFYALRTIGMRQVKG